MAVSAAAIAAIAQIAAQIIGSTGEQNTPATQINPLTSQFYQQLEAALGRSTNEAKSGSGSSLWCSGSTRWFSRGNNKEQQMR